MTNAQLARRWFEEVWNQKREAAIDELLAADGIAYGLGEAGRELPGPEAFRQFWRKMIGAFPDIHINIEDAISEGDRTALRFSFTGTHRGDQLGIPPTGRQIRVTGMSFTRWRNGQIAEGWNEFDVAALMQQINAPPHASAKA